MVFVRDWEVGGMGRLVKGYKHSVKMKVLGHGVLGKMIK